MSVFDKLLERMPQKGKNAIGLAKEAVSTIEQITPQVQQEARGYYKMARKLSAFGFWRLIETVLVTIVINHYIEFMTHNVFTDPAIDVIRIYTGYALNMAIFVVIFDTINSNFWYQYQRKRVIAMEDRIVTRAEKKNIRSLTGVFAGIGIVAITIAFMINWAAFRYNIILQPYGMIELWGYNAYASVLEFGLLLILMGISLLTTYLPWKNFSLLLLMNHDWKMDRTKVMKRKALLPRNLIK